MAKSRIQKNFKFQNLTDFLRFRPPRGITRTPNPGSDRVKLSPALLVSLCMKEGADLNTICVKNFIDCDIIFSFG